MLRILYLTHPAQGGEEEETIATLDVAVQLQLFLLLEECT